MKTPFEKEPHFENLNYHLKALIVTVYLSRKRSGQFDLQRLSALELTLFADLGRKESIIKPSFGSVMEPIYYTES